MILVTVGTQLPFDRLIEAIDNIAPRIEETIFAQTGPSAYRPKNFEFHATVAPKLFDEKFQQASRVVSHAGIGSVLTARKYKKPIILFPRRAAFGEHRNDHQIATCNRLEGKAGIYVAKDEAQIQTLLFSSLTHETDTASAMSNGAATFADRIAKFIEETR